MVTLEGEVAGGEAQDFFWDQLKCPKIDSGDSCTTLRISQNLLNCTF